MLLPALLDVRVSRTIEPSSESEYPGISIQAFLNNNAGVYSYQGQTSFTPEQLEQDCAIAPSNAGDFLNLERNKISVVGRTHHFSNDVVFIPIRSFLEHGFSPDSVELILDATPPRKKNNHILERLAVLFPANQHCRSLPIHPGRPKPQSWRHGDDQRYLSHLYSVVSIPISIFDPGKTATKMWCILW